MKSFQQWMDELARPASMMVIDETAMPKDAYGSWFGRVSLGAPGEPWPMGNAGPMWPLLQIITRELPYLPKAIEDIALIRVYVDSTFTCQTENGGACFYHPEGVTGQGWLLRVSSTLDGLVSISEPNHESRIAPAPVTWNLVEKDCPMFEDWPDDMPESTRREHTDLLDPPELAIQGTKVGGWPYLVQSDIYWAPWQQHPHNPEYVFQIDSDYDRGWMWGDTGVAYFGRGTGQHRNHWAMDWQCY